MNAIVDIELPSLAANQSCSLGLPRYLARRAGLAASVGHYSRYSYWRSDDWREQFTAAARDHWGAKIWRQLQRMSVEPDSGTPVLLSHEIRGPCYRHVFAGGGPLKPARSSRKYAQRI